MCRPLAGAMEPHADLAQRRYDAAAVAEAQSQLLALTTAILLEPLDPDLLARLRSYADGVGLRAQAAARRLGLTSFDLDADADDGFGVAARPDLATVTALEAFQ